jgi:hypothetical protein
MAGLQEDWLSLHTPPEELLLANTLVTGQSFRWRRTDDSSSCYEMYTGVIGQRLVQMRQLPNDVQYRVLARRCAQDHIPSQPLTVPPLLHSMFTLVDEQNATHIRTYMFWCAHLCQSSYCYCCLTPACLPACLRDTLSAALQLHRRPRS